MDQQMTLHSAAHAAFDAPDTLPDKPTRQDLEQLGEAIALLSAQIDAASWRLLQMIAAFDRSAGWADGFRSCAHWLSWRVGWDPATARERVRVARALAELPLISEALRQGQMSYSKVRAMTRVARPDNEQDLLVMAKSGTAAHLERIVRATRRATGAEEQSQCQAQRQRQYWQTYTDEEGMLVVRGRLPPEIGAALQQAVDQAMDTLQEHQEGPRGDSEPKGAHDGGGSNDVRGSGDAGHPAQRPCCAGEELGIADLRVEAVGLVAEQSLASKPGSRAPALVVVHVDAAALADPGQAGRCHLEHGERVSAETARRLACDGTAVDVRSDGQGQPLDVGRTTRRIGKRLSRALQQRDQTCCFPGCERSRKLHAHHIKHWAAGGETSLDNTLLLCTFHHVLVHEGGWSVKGAGAAPQFVDPRGEEIAACPAPAPWSAQPAAELIAASQRSGVMIDATTNRPTWSGYPVDYSWAVDVLLPKEAQSPGSG